MNVSCLSQILQNEPASLTGQFHGMFTLVHTRDHKNIFIWMKKRLYQDPERPVFMHWKFLVTFSHRKGRLKLNISEKVWLFFFFQTQVRWSQKITANFKWMACLSYNNYNNITLCFWVVNNVIEYKVWVVAT